MSRIKPVNFKIALLRHKSIMPTKAHDDDACYDIYACFEGTTIMIKPNETVLVPSGFATEIPAGWFAAIFPRSGLSSKKGLTLANCTGIIDAGYRNEWMVPIHNQSKDTQYIYHGDRIAQFMLLPVIETSMEIVTEEELSNSDRGQGGFGSTGA